MQDSNIFWDKQLISGSAAIVAVSEDDIKAVASRSFTLPADVGAAANLLNGALPGAVAVADAVGQYGHAIIRFPEGKGWDDLFDRKTLGWEGWKHPVARANDGGVGGGNVAIMQAGLSPAAIANIGLNAAAMIVGQAYMAKIDKRLEGIERGIDEILSVMDDRKLAKLRGHARTLSDYYDGYVLYDSNEDTRIRAINVLANTLTSIAISTENELLALDRLSKKVLAEKRIGGKKAKQRLAEVNSAANRALFAVGLEMTARRLLVQYEEQYTCARIEHEINRIQTVCNEYEQCCSKLRTALSTVAGMAALPSVAQVFEGLQYDKKGKRQDGLSPIAKLGGIALAGGLFLSAGAYVGSQLAHGDAEERRDIDRLAAGIGGQVGGLFSEFKRDLDNLHFIHEEANTLALTNDSLRFMLIEGSK